MNINIKLHKNDLPDDLNLGNLLAVDGEFMGLNLIAFLMNVSCYNSNLIVIFC